MPSKRPMPKPRKTSFKTRNPRTGRKVRMYIRQSGQVTSNTRKFQVGIKEGEEIVMLPNQAFNMREKPAIEHISGSGMVKFKDRRKSVKRKPRTKK